MALCVAGSSASAAPAPLDTAAQHPTDQPRRIADLVQQLGAPSFRVRESATRALAAEGVPAKAALLNALSSPDAEIRRRARIVLGEVLEQDWRERLEAFIVDTRGAHDHELPGWRRFRELFGDDTQARRLFAEMQRSEPTLLEAAEQGHLQAGESFDVRCQQIQDALRVPGRVAERQLPLGSVAALLFVGAEHGVEITMQSSMYVTNFCYQAPFNQAIAASDNAALLRRLLGLWIRRDFGNDTTAAHQTMMLALKYNVRDGIEPALAMLKQGNGNPHTRQYPILVVAKFGQAADIATLEPLLEEKGICAQQQVGNMKIVETQLRDVVLAAMVHLSGQKLADYGFDRAQPNGTMLFNTATLGFAKPEDREAALAKWRAWRAEQGAPKESGAGTPEAPK